MPIRLLMPFLATVLAAAAPPLPAQLLDPSTTEGWIWQQARAGKNADLNDRCNTPHLSVHQRKDPLWQARCRRVDPVLLRALLTQADLADHAPYGVRIIGARIGGPLDISDAHIRAAEVWLSGCWIAGDAFLSDLQLDGLLVLNGSFIEGQFFSERTVIGSSLQTREAVFAGPVDLSEAYIKVEMDMAGATIAKSFNAEALHVGGSLFLRKVTFGDLVNLRTAHVEGQMSMDESSIANLFNAEVLRVGSGGLFIQNVKFSGPVDLRGAHVDGVTQMDRTTLQQKFDAEGLYVGTLLSLNNVKFGGPVSLLDAHVESQMSMENASLADQQTFNAERLYVGNGSLIMRNTKFGGPIVLRSAHVEGQVVMTGARVAENQMFNGELLHVGAELFLDEVTFGGPVDLGGAHIGNAMEMEGTNIAGQQTFNAPGLDVGAGLSLTNVTFGGPVDLGGARIAGRMFMADASVADQQTFNAERLHVGSDFLAPSTSFGGAANFLGLSVDGDLDFRESHVLQLNLTGAVIRDDLLLGGRYRDGSEHWLRWNACKGPSPCLNLRNARVGNLQDDERAWPPRMTLEGFTYTHLGSVGGEQRQDMRTRAIGWWRGWLNSDPVFSAQPYAQLASVLAAAGNRDGAADIRFFGRDRERSELLRGCPWLQKLGLVEKANDDRACGLRQWSAWAGLTILQVFVGYGIGDYSFRAVFWALALALIGTAILCCAPGVRGLRPTYTGMAAAPRGPRQKPLLWCFGASLHQVLPLVTISQEFSEFFNDPKRERLHSWQHLAFGVLALCGWALGLFVVAAFSGLIQT